MINTVTGAPAWKVLLLGGHSGVGKTVVARHVAHQYRVGLAEIDDFRLVLQRVTTPQQQPVLHSFLANDMFGWSADDTLKRLIAVNTIVCSALEIVVANHVATNTPCLLEGDGILPAFAAQSMFADLDVQDAVRAVFVIEENKEQILVNMQRRGRSFDTFSPQQQQHWVELSWHYGQWLAREAIRYNLPLVPAQPWNTLAARIQQAIEA